MVSIIFSSYACDVGNTDGTRRTLVDPILMVIGLTQTCFEGSMYLFVFVWVPSLQDVSPSFPTVALPLGYIFSSFMVSMMLGSLLYTAITSYLPPPTLGSRNESSLTLHAKLSSLVCAVSALALALSTRSESEHVRFWAFCAFEACVGMYYPVQGMLRGTLISNEHRATVSLSSLYSRFAPLLMSTLSLAVVGTIPRPTERLRRGVSHDGCFIRPECSPFCKFVDVGIFSARDRLRGRFESG